MSYLKLVKLLYLLDREALIRWGRPVTTDRHCSMNHGLVVSNIYNLIKDEIPPGEHSIWRDFISFPQNYEVELVSGKEAGSDELSMAEEELIEEIFGKFGKLGRWDLVKLTHELPEYVDPHGSSLTIEFRDILKAGKKTEAEIEKIETEIEDLALSEVIFQLQ
jgi:uncharacterized phage-associated protein